MNGAEKQHGRDERRPLQSKGEVTVMGMFEREDIRLLVRAILNLQNEEECRLFLEDLLTAKEIEDAAQRLQVAQRLLRGVHYADISEETGASSATISRVNRCVVYGAGGYETVLKKLS